MVLGQSPLLQITNNRVNSIKFPRLKQVHCLKNRRRKCVVIGENWGINGSHRTEITVNEQNMVGAEFFRREVEMKFNDEEENEVDEKDEVAWMTKDEYEEKLGTALSPHGYSFEDFYANFFVPSRLHLSETLSSRVVSARYVHGLVSLLFLILSGAVIVSTVFRPKRKTLRLLSEKYEYKDNWGRQFVPLE